MDITVTQFKAKCLGLVEKVQREKCRITISRHGRAAAELVPAPGAESCPPLFGRSAEDTEILGDLLETGEPWNAAS